MKLQESKLGSGLTVITEKVEYSPVFALGITVMAGASDSGVEKEGIAHNLEHLIFRRADDDDTEEMARKFEAAGGYMNAFTTHESTGFYVRAMNENFAHVFSLLCELIVDAEFDESANEKEKNVILEEIYADEDEPEEYIFDEADRFMFENHPFGNSISGKEESLQNISIDDLRTFYQKYYCLNNIAVTAVGNVEHDEVIALAERLLRLPSGDKKQVFAVNPRPVVRPVLKQLRMPIKQSHLVYGSFFGRKDRKLSSLASSIVADGMSSRLYREIREKQGLAYSVYSTLQNYSQCGVFYVYSAFSSKNAGKVMQAIEEEYDKLKTFGISYEEYGRTIEMVKTAFAMEMEDLAARMIRLSKYFIFNAEVETVEEEKIGYQKISYEDLNRFITKHFNRDRLKKILLKGK